jgi:hypothetical protein
MDQIEDIPQELIEILEQRRAEKEERMRQLDALGFKISKLRDEAVAARRSSGIETRWREDEEYYEGIDDLNRSEDTYLKPRSTSGGLISNNPVKSTRCTAFFNITRQFVDSAAARAGDILLPSNDWNFSIKPTPIPDFEQHKEDERTMLVDPQGKPISVGSIITGRLKEASERVKKAEIRIMDWLVECGYKKEYRKMIEDAALVGTGILKGPVPVKRTTRKFSGGALVIEETIAPATQNVSYWDLFPDPSCGDNIHDGAYVVERDFMSARQLRDLKGSGLGYIDEAIDKVLKEGPGKSNETGSSPKETKDDERFEVWYYYGDISARDIGLMDNLGGGDLGEDPEEDLSQDAIPGIVVMVNDTVIKGYSSALEDGKFPFDLMVWQRMAGSPFGIGVARQGRTAQKMVLSATRALMDNMGLSAVPMLALMRSALQPVDGSWDLSPGKQWIIKESSGIKNANEAIQSIEIPSLQAELMNIIQLGMKMMEDATGVSFLLQGQQGSAPDTVGGMQLLHQNASALLRRIARNGDEVTTAHISRYYDWLLMHGEDDEEKGDMMIEAVGSTALVERELQSMQLPQLLQLALDPRYEKSPKKVYDEILRAWRFDPGKFDMDEEEIQKLQQQAHSQPVAPQIQAAQIRAETDLKKAQMQQEATLQAASMDRDRDTLHIQAQSERDRITYEARIAELQLKRELELLRYANEQKLSLDKVKADLAATAMKIQSTKELAAMNATADQLPKPPIEPPGRSPTGQSFTR